MLIEFLNEDRELSVNKSSISIGGGATDDVRLPGLAEHFARLNSDSRGLVLLIYGQNVPVQVNDRAVVNKALVRFGDSLRFGDHGVKLRSNRPPPIPEDDDWLHDSERLSDVRLRCVDTSTASGEAFELAQGDSTRPGNDDHFKVLLGKNAAIAASGGDKLEVNGHIVDSAILQIGDQLRVGKRRFIIEGSRLPTRKLQPITGENKVVTDLPPPPATTKRAWWQRALVAAIMLVLAYGLWWMLV